MDSGFGFYRVVFWRVGFLCLCVGFRSLSSGFQPFASTQCQPFGFGVWVCGLMSGCLKEATIDRFSAFCLHSVSTFWVLVVGVGFWVFKGDTSREVFSLLPPHRFNLLGLGFGFVCCGLWV